MEGFSSDSMWLGCVGYSFLELEQGLVDVWVYGDDSEADDDSDGMENGVLMQARILCWKEWEFLLGLVMELLVLNVWSEQDLREEMIQDLIMIKKENRDDAEKIVW